MSLCYYYCKKRTTTYCVFLLLLFVLVCNYFLWSEPPKNLSDADAETADSEVLFHRGGVWTAAGQSDVNEQQQKHHEQAKQVPQPPIPSLEEFTLDEDCHCKMVPKGSNEGNKSTCSPYATSRGPGQVIFSYALYGKKKGGYAKGVPVNLEGIRKFYPGSIMRLYYDRREDDPPEDIQKLCKIFCDNPDIDLCNSKDIDKYGDISESFGMVWRFSPMADPLVSEWHSRDLDSEISAREKAAVEEWRNSSATYHIMRDNPYHGTSILGGMFGMRLNDGNLKQMRKDFEKMLRDSRSRWHKGLDQALLSQHVWPRARLDSVSHDSFLCRRYPGTRPWPTRRVNGPNFSPPNENNFVGSNGGRISLENVKPCPRACRPKDHQDWELC